MSAFRVSLRAGERIFVNGAVIRVGRKTSFEFLNDVEFLLEQHVLQLDAATTPLRQLYFILQVVLMTPAEGEAARKAFRASLSGLLATSDNAELAAELKAIDRLVGEGKVFDALRSLRSLFPKEKAGPASPPTPPVRTGYRQPEVVS